MLKHPAWRQRRALLTVLVISVLFCALWSLRSHPRTQKEFAIRSETEHLPCRNLPGANETFVILRTGATEIADRLPVHTKTTLRCFPNRLVFSDFEENFQGEHVIDVLDSVSLKIRQRHPDFELYRRLKRGGRAALDPSELSGSETRSAHNSENSNNPKQKLDKWTFLPTMSRALYEYPDTKWYIFVEANTYILWSTLLRYLATVDHSQPLYGGVERTIDNERFAHSESVFVVSQRALRMLVDFYSANKAELESATEALGAGDRVLGQAFQRAGVELMNLFPMFQANPPGLISYGFSDGQTTPEEGVRLWCGPAVAYHNVSPTEVGELWRFEQRWLRNNDPSDDILRHKDVFKQYVMPQMIHPREDWDNLSDEDAFDDGDFANSFDECRRRCQSKAECRQFSYNYGGRCKTRTDPMLGGRKEGIASGWIFERVARWEQHMQPCGRETFELLGEG